MNYPDYVLKYKTEGVEIRKFRDKYYAYRITSVYDREKKRARKVTLGYLGIVTENGIVRANDNIIRYDYEYGNINYILSLTSNLIKILKDEFTKDYNDILSLSIIRLLSPLPIRSINYYLDKTYLNKITSLNPKKISLLLKNTGSSNKIYNVMKRLSTGKRYLLMDLTAFISYSNNIEYLEKGYNKDHLQLPQYNLIMMYSIDYKVPAYMRLVYGSIRDIKTLVKTIDIADINNVVIIADSGFYSSTNISKMETSHIKYVVPLKRNNKLIKINNDFTDVFLYHNRPIKYWNVINVDKKHIYVFEDIKLKSEEDRARLLAMDNNKSLKNKYSKLEKHFGKIYLYSNINEKPENIYNMYKDRDNIEKSFDILKNIIDSDKSYLRDNDTLNGYMFVNFISLYIYYNILNDLRERGISNKYSVKDILLLFSKIKVFNLNNKEVFGEVPKKVEKLYELLKVDNDILRKYVRV